MDDNQKLINLMFKHSLLVEAIAETHHFADNVRQGIWREERQVYAELCELQDKINKENG